MFNDQFSIFFMKNCNKEFIIYKIIKEKACIV